MESNKEHDLLSHYVSNNARSCIRNDSYNSTLENVDTDSEHSFVCKQTVSENESSNPSLSRKRADAVQEINIVTIDEPESNNTNSAPFTCLASVSTNAKRKRNSLESQEYVTSEMFEAFMESHNKQMELVKNSIQSLNDSFYEEDEFYEEEEDDYYSEEEEPPRKKSRSDNFNDSSFVDNGISGRDKPSDSQPRATHADEVIESPNKRLGGSDGQTGSKQTTHGSARDNFQSLLDKKLNEFSNEEKTGPKVKENLAKMVNSLTTSAMDTTVKNSLFDKFLGPENCNLNSPRVNDVIWDLCMDGFGRSLDVKLQAVQRMLLTGMIPVVNVANKLLVTDQKDDNQTFVESLLNDLLDGLALLASASYSLSMYRRTNLKQFLNEKYSTLCSSQTQVTDMLFGDNVCEKIDSLTKGQKAAALVASNEQVPPSYRYKGSSRHRRRGGSRGYPRSVRGRFLGRRGSGRGGRKLGSSHGSIRSASQKDKDRKKDM